MNSTDIARWKNDEVTRYYFKLLDEARVELSNEILRFTPATPNFNDSFFFLRGQLEGVITAIEAELEEGDNEIV